MAKYRKLPVEIEAFQMSYEMALGLDKVPSWFASASLLGDVKVYVTEKINNSQYCTIKTLEGIMKANSEDYIIQGVNGEIYPCKKEIFEKTYEQI